MRVLRVIPLFLALFLSTIAFSAEETIVDIEFKGAKTLTESRLDGLVGSTIGKPYDAQQIQQDIKSLSAVARKVEVYRQVQPGGVKLIFTIQENPPIRDISIVGNSRISTERLIKTMPIQEGETLATDAVARTREKILRDYHTAGHSGTEVRIETLDNPDGSVNLQVFINEGERIKAESIKIVGAKNLSSVRIRQHMESRGSWLFFDNYYDETTFAEDLEAIRRLYVSYGYFDAKVRRGEFAYDAGKKSVTPVIQIEEGKRYTIGDVDVQGATYFTPVEVRTPFQKLKGRPYNASEVAKAIEELRSLYGNEGFILTEFNEDYAFETDGAKVNVLIKINERQRVRVGDVVIERAAPMVDAEQEGFFTRFYNRISPPVKDETIKREVRLKPGDVYRRNQERQTIERLERLGIFEDVQSHAEPTDDEAVQNLVLRVEEGVTGSVIVGAGYGDASGAYVFATYTERNLFGEARDLQARLMLGTRSTTGNISYLDSYFRPDGTSLQVDLYKTGYHRRGYDEDELGVSAELGKPLSEYTTLYPRARTSYVWLEKDDDDLDEDLDDYPVATLGELGRGEIGGEHSAASACGTKKCYPAVRAGGADLLYRYCVHPRAAVPGKSNAQSS